MIRYAIVFGLGLLVAGVGQDWRYSAKISRIETKQADSETDAERDARQELADALKKQGELQAQISASDALRTKEREDAQSIIDEQRLALERTGGRLRVNASCPAVAAPDPVGVPQTAAAASVGDAPSPRLTHSAERDYWTLRKRIEEAKGQIAVLQDYAATCWQPRAAGAIQHPAD